MTTGLVLKVRRSRLTFREGQHTLRPLLFCMGGHTCDCRLKSPLVFFTPALWVFVSFKNPLSPSRRRTGFRGNVSHKAPIQVKQAVLKDHQTLFCFWS